MTPSADAVARAREIHATILREAVKHGEPRTLSEVAADVIAASLTEARAQAVEACAKVVEGSAEFDASDDAAQVAIKCGITKALAAALRALVGAGA